MTCDADILASATEPANRDFVTAWLRWRGPRSVPRRGDLDLVSIRRLMPMLLLTEVIAPDQVPVRVAGTRLRDYLGFEITGANYIELAPPEQRAIRGYRTWRIAMKPCGSRLIYHHRFASGRVMTAEVVSLPLDTEQPTGQRLMLAHIAPLQAAEPIPDRPASPYVELAASFAYLDIGHGVPERDLPPVELPRVA